jgi:hypothetical protein
VITAFVPIRTGRGLNDRMHWAARARKVKYEREAVQWALNGNSRPWLPCSVTLIRCAPSNGLDGDNLQGALKACRDGVAQWLGVDDADARVTWNYAQRREKGYSVVVRIEGARC